VKRRAGSFDVAIVGAGPAGMAAACAASECGQKVAVLDESGTAGGQIWRGATSVNRLSAGWLDRFRRAPVELHITARVAAVDAASKVLLVENSEGSYTIRYKALVIATGARERFLPFPGWTLPNVMGAGALQAFAKNGLPVRDKRVVVAGSGPLLLAVASFLRKHGAEVSLIAEQASWRSVAAFGVRLARWPSKLREAIALKTALGSIPYRTGCWVRSAEGSDRVTAAQLQSGSGRWAIPCDFLAIGYGLVANTELAASAGCRLTADGLAVDEWQRTTVPGIFSAGEPTGVGGVDLALVEGEIAGYAASGQTERARSLFSRRIREAGFAGALNKAFALHPALKQLPSANTLVCRCEDVPYGALESFSDWRSAKLQTRCGMGPCQGRICGAAAEFLWGWRAESARPPVLPVRIETLTQTDRI
jgi:NADPH-dependent 2,4-dienoyl-CoA reductase/sulfur reductase-like enzyme